jgi:hypothetical protein
LIVPVLAAVLATASVVNGGEPAKASGQRGPGLQGPATDLLKLPVPRSYDLNHLEPAHFGEALGKDPQRIFEFVRDHVAYEVYSGCLRGPRGTLLAMAGNSVDRAALLASMLEASGQKVRFARGTLSDADAKELVLSMWAERPVPETAKVEGDPPPGAKGCKDVLLAAVERDYRLLTGSLRQIDAAPDRDPGPTLESLVQEAREHCWVQWSDGGTWVDLDPSFADSTPGRPHAESVETFEALPESLFHQVAIRLLAEEHAVLLKGDEEAEVTHREVLQYAAKAADLSGRDLVLVHQPEKWEGPVEDLASALASALEDTGKVKPVLIVGEETWIVGEPFQLSLPATGGIGGVGTALGGGGTRKPIPLATALRMEIDFVAPSGETDAVVREMFDIVGKARRAEGEPLRMDEIRTRAKETEEQNAANAVYDLWFTTGRLDASALAHLADEALPPDDEPADVRKMLRRINITFSAMSDALLPRFATSDGPGVIYYPESPGLLIAELALPAKNSRLSLDLRRRPARALALDSGRDEVFAARVFRGVVDATLERVLMEYVGGGAGEEAELDPPISTSLVFEKSFTGRSAPLLLPADMDRLDPDIPPDALARLRGELMIDGQIAVAPAGAVTLGGTPRFAWWRIDLRSGETVAVTDEGLHGATGPELSTVKVKIGSGSVAVVHTRYLGGTARFVTQTTYRYAQRAGFYELLRRLIAEGARFLGEIPRR